MLADLLSSGKSGTSMTERRTEDEGSQAAGRAAAPLLRIRGGKQAGAEIPVAKPIVVGREADLTLDDSEVSRRHATIFVEGDALVIEDLASSNGTWVNSRRVERAALKAGDVVRLGRTILDVVGGVEAATTTHRSARVSRRSAGRPSIERQLRPITALFADVVGSTAVGERLDPDELGTIMSECVALMTEAVETFGGTVSTYSGDGIAAFFGLEQASAEDAEHAARAALAIIAGVATYAADVERAWQISDFNVRVGLNTGDAAVAAVGSADRPNVALGDTTNVAARLQAMAEPGTIAVGEETAEELRGRFLLVPLGEVDIRGRQAPVRAWQLRGALQRPNVPVRRRLLGRDAELGALRSALDDVCAGRGGILFVVGDIGIGKTRLIAELEELAGQRATLLQAFCAAVPAPPPYGPFAAMLLAWLGLDADDRRPVVVESLERRLTALDGLAPGTPEGLARLLNLSVDKSDPHVADPIRAYADWVEALTSERPVVIALDDIHWLEASSAFLAVQLAELAMQLPLLLVATLRPDRESHGWSLRTSARAAHPSRAQELQLARLSDEDAREVLRELAPATDSDAAEELIQRAEGNPLFLEQLIRAWQEGASVRSEAGDVRTVATARLLPPALASIFVGRIDRLPPETRAVAQTAAAIGRTFTEDLLTRVVDLEAVDAALPALIAAGIAAEHEPPPARSWTFTHALLRDAVLSTLVRSRRREIFGQVAAAAERAVATDPDGHVELLAYYYARSDNSAKALCYQERAAEKALRVGADTEASVRLRAAAQLAKQLNDDEAARRITARRRGLP